MKKFYLFTPLMTLTLLVFLLLGGCKKEVSAGLTPQEEKNVATLSSQSETESELVFNDVFDNVMGVNAEVGLGGTGVFGRVATSGLVTGRESGADSIPSCVTLTVNHLNAPDFFPVRITIDFGSGCLGKDGHIRSGKIIATYTGRLTVPGKSVTTSFDSFFLDSIGVQGNHTLTNTTVAGSNQRQFTIDVTNARLSKPSGNYSQWTSHRVVTQVEGNATPDLSIDDVFSITGSAYGKVYNGNEAFAWHSEITEPLRKRFSCHWISKGILTCWRETLNSSSPWAAVLNYGDGTCDFLATLTINGVTTTIKLPH
ncbi:MAG: hypothetical protein ACXVB3_09190 [Flavisolibacter sp.]